MKIAFFVNTFPSSSQTFILRQIVSLVNAGHQVDVFARKKDDLGLESPVFPGKNPVEKTRYYGWYLEASRRSRVGRYFCSGVNLIKAFRQHPISTVNFLVVSGFGRRVESYKIFNDALVLLQGDRLDYDIVHCHFGPHGNLAALLKAIGFVRGKLVTTFHGYDMSKYIQTNGPDVYNFLFKVGDLFLPVSERWKECLVRLGCDESKIIVHRMGVEFDDIPLGCIKTKVKIVNLLTVARLVEKKGVVYAVKAVSEALKKHPYLNYKIVGDGPLMSSLNKLVEDLGVRANIEFLGWKSQEEIFGLLKETDIFMAPSVTDEKGDQEGVPVSIMEAMAHGIPVLSTWHSGIPELVQDGKSGYLVAERNIDTLAEKITYLVENPERCAEMGKLGRNFVLKNYDNNKLNDRLIEIFKEMLGDDSTMTQKASSGLA